MNRRDRIARNYIRYKATPAFLVFWVMAGAFVWAIVLYAGVSLGACIPQLIQAVKEIL
jgi:hypothetical protein